MWNMPNIVSPFKDNEELSFMRLVDMTRVGRFHPQAWTWTLYKDSPNSPYLKCKVHRGGEVFYNHMWAMPTVTPKKVIPFLETTFGVTVQSSLTEAEVAAYVEQDRIQETEMRGFRGAAAKRRLRNSEGSFVANAE